MESRPRSEQVWAADGRPQSRGCLAMCCLALVFYLVSISSLLPFTMGMVTLPWEICNLPFEFHKGSQI